MKKVPSEAPVLSDDSCQFSGCGDPRLLLNTIFKLIHLSYPSPPSPAFSHWTLSSKLRLVRSPKPSPCLAPWLPHLLVISVFFFNDDTKKAIHTSVGERDKKHTFWPIFNEKRNFLETSKKSKNVVKCRDNRPTTQSRLHTSHTLSWRPSINWCERLEVVRLAIFILVSLKLLNNFN